MSISPLPQEPSPSGDNLIAAGKPVDTITVQIDYNIIRHFSEHLYGSPNKAIEELVSNGFDAFASEVHVYIPGRFVNDCVLVWDDGSSMDVDDLHKLWWIAQSPKTGDRMVTGSGGTARAMIGKFGIGKLASYAVGHRMTHLCRRGNRFLLVRVDYRDVPHIAEHEQPKAYQTPIVELTERRAREYLNVLFRQMGDAVDKLWSRPHWTLAIIDELRTDVRLTEGRLRWVVGNGMPLRPDFHVWVGTIQVPILSTASGEQRMQPSTYLPTGRSS